MKKNKILNNKGFVLAETLIATMFVAIIFSVILINFYPMMGEYEKRENYDDIDSKYGAYWAKRYIEDSDYNIKYPAERYTPFSVVKNREVKCSDLYPSNTVKQNQCSILWSNLNISKVIITDYDITDFKEIVDKKQFNTSSFSNGLVEYINYLPKYNNYPSLYGSKYRVIVEFTRHIGNVLDKNKSEEYNTYSTMEVKK